MISSGSTFYVTNGMFVTCDKIRIKLSACLICGGFVTKWRNLTSKVCLCLIFAGEKIWITYHVDFPHIFYQTADKCQSCANGAIVREHRNVTLFTRMSLIFARMIMIIITMIIRMTLTWISLISLAIITIITIIMTIMIITWMSLISLAACCSCSQVPPQSPRLLLFSKWRCRK